MDEKIKVNDKRMFDLSGELREEYRQGDEKRAPASVAEGDVAKEPTSPGPQVVTEPADAVVEPGEPDAAEPPEGAQGATGAERLPDPEFMDLVGLLAQPIAMFLGDAPLPDGGSAKNLPLARYHIDLLELVQTRTRGNLSPQEAKVLEDLLYQLRMRYVEKAG